LISAGIDCGAKTTKVVIMKDGKIIGKAKVLTGFDQNKAIMEAWDLALKNAKVSAGDVKQVCGTGSGKNAVKSSFPGTRDFAINEKCAAGAGAFIEAMGRALETPLEQMGLLALKSDKEIPMNAQCAIFAESEVVGLIHAKTAKQDISKSIHDAMASRIISMIRRIGVNEEVVMLGGVGYNPGFVEAMRRQLSIPKLFIPEEPEFGMAVGAAVVAAEED